MNCIALVPWNLLEYVPDIGDSISPCLQFSNQCLDVPHAESRASSFGEQGDNSPSICDLIWENVH